MISYNEILESISLGDIIYFITGIIAVLSVVVENTKKLPFNPWTRILNWIGKRITNDINQRLSEIEEQQKANIEAVNMLEEKMDKEFKEHIKQADKKEAKRLRQSIVEFADACRCGVQHTQNHFENVMRDYGDYVQYCETHDIPNHFIDSDYAYIEGLYQECLKENKFL